MYDGVAMLAMGGDGGDAGDCWQVLAMGVYTSP